MQRVDFFDEKGCRYVPVVHVGIMRVLRLLTLNHNFHLSSVDTAIVHWDYWFIQNRCLSVRWSVSRWFYIVLSNSKRCVSSLFSPSHFYGFIEFETLSAQNCLICVLNVVTWDRDRERERFKRWGQVFHFSASIWHKSFSNAVLFDSLLIHHHNESNKRRFFPHFNDW